VSARRTLDGQPFLRGARRTAHAPDAPLGLRHLRRRHCRAHGARVLHGAFRKPRELTGRLVSRCSPRHRERLPRLLAADDLISGTVFALLFDCLGHAGVGTYIAFWLFGGNFRVPRLSAFLHPARADHSGHHAGAGWRAPLPAGAPEAHAVPGKENREKRGGFAHVPVFMARPRGSYSSSGDNCALIRVRPDKSHLAVRSLRGLSHLLRRAARLYMAFLDGALRIWPSWTSTASAIQSVRGIRTGDRVPRSRLRVVLHVADDRTDIYEGQRAAYLLDRPINRPKRTALACRWACSSRYSSSPVHDVIANFFHVSLEEVLIAMRVLVVITPLISYPVTYKICKEYKRPRAESARWPIRSRVPRKANTSLRPRRSTLTTCTATSPHASAALHCAVARRGRRGQCTRVVER